MEAVKFVDGSDNLIEGPGIPFGGPLVGRDGQGRDLHGEFFTAKTDLALDWFDARPLLYHHGLDGDLQIVPVGVVKSWETKADVGVWTQAQLDESNEYFDAIRDLVRQGKLFFSSGSMPHLVKTDRKTGEIVRWPWVELSLTPSPANPYATVDEATAEKHFKSVGLAATWTTAYQNDLPDSAFAVILPGGEKDDDGKTTPRSLRKLPHHDADGKLDLPHLRNALARLPQTDGLSESQKSRAMSHLEKHSKAAGVGEGKSVTNWPGHDAEYIKALPDGPVPVMDEHGCAAPGSYEALSAHINRKLNASMGLTGYCYVIATFPDYVTAVAYEGAESHYYQIEYVLADDGMPVLGEMREVEQVYIPKEQSPLEDGPLAMASARFIDFTASLRQRTQDLAERRAKEHRPLSAESRAHIATAMAAADSMLTDVRTLLADTDPGTEGPSVELMKVRLQLLKTKLKVRDLLPA